MKVQLPLPVGLDDHARFATFFAGPNEALVRHLQDFLRMTVPVTWIWGAAGTGKTHLLQAVCAEAGQLGIESAYFSLEDSGSLTPDLLDGWPDLRIACVDNLDQVAGDAAWENALFRLFNELGERRGAMLVAAESGPQQLQMTLPDLRSRLSWGPVFRLGPLSDSERVEALRLRAGHRGLDLSDEVGEWLLRRAPRDMQSLYRLLDTLDLASLAEQRRLTIPFVKKILEQQQRLGGTQDA